MAKQWTQQEQEYHAHQAPAELVDGQYTTPQPANDVAHRIHHYDSQQTWTVDAYDRRAIVDFPKRRKRQYSEETLAKLRERGRTLQAAQKTGSLLEANGHFSAPESTKQAEVK